ncbi:hypothetical protein BJ875DRAFT_401044 [Amylocarpus encephaloides]|uniref:Uncharacterized protein n=1 Tax=Amylocarpus encephaloides TaxID=45428 RepID=A0A9P7YK09_9HELO|nr:hypothetical protein BJ875DRAFT_401044 [Amylocarpus encephaloides]
MHGFESKNTGKEKDQGGFIVDNEEDTKEPVLEAKIPGQLVVAPECVIEAYDNLFRAYYNQPLNIDKIMFGEAIDQMESLLVLADVYGLPEETSARAQMAQVLTSFEGVWREISEDPARWLKVAVALRCEAIFKEAIIHIVGSHPKQHPFIINDIKTAEAVHELIRAKINELDVKRASADLALLEVKCSIVDMRTAARNSFTYEIYRTWHDHNHCTMIQALYARRSSRNADLIRYRQLAAGGDAYLSIEKVVGDYKEDFPNIGVELDEEDEDEVVTALLGMKRAAEIICSPLVVSELQLAESDRLDINYLTCTTIYDHELPWNA